MGMNFYAVKLPTKERREELKKLIDSEEFPNVILDEINTTYGKVRLDGNTLIGNELLIGHRSAGWKFLWNPNVYVIHHGHMLSNHYVQDKNTLYYIYPLTKEGIWNYLSDPSIIIVNEYNEKQEDKKKFFNDALNWTTWEGEEAWDSQSFKNWCISNEKTYYDHPCKTELVNELISEGYKMISSDCTDFYSDGLRFSTCTDFK